MRTLTAVLLAAAALLAACKKDEKATGATKAADATPAVAPTADASAAAATDPMANDAGNCPSTVVGAETTVDPKASTGGAVVLLITTRDEPAVATIRARARHLVEIQGAPDATVQHTGEGTGGGRAGLCPVFAPEGARLTAEDVPGGAKVTITPAAPDQGAKLLADVEQRITKAKAWTASNIQQTGEFGAKGGDGGGKGGHGANRTGKGDATGPRNADAGAGAAPEAK